MHKKSTLLLLFVLLVIPYFLNAQSKSVPAFTGYAVPAEEINANGDSRIFTKNGIEHWTNPKQEIQFYLHLREKGQLNLSILVKNNIAGNKIMLSIAQKNFIVTIPSSKNFVRISIGTVAIADTGTYLLRLSSVVKKGNLIADIRSLELDGPATKNIHTNLVARRNAASVHLFYPLADSMKAISFYNEITVPTNADVLHSYYMACGFARGYFGIQVNSPTERRVIFSVWDAGSEAADRSKVSSVNKVELMAKGEEVITNDFGNEGTGGHSHWIYNWKAGQTYKFLVTAATDSAKATTDYAAYFYIPEIQKWKLIACFKAPKDGKPLRRLYSFVENFDGSNGQLLRKAYFGNQWIRRENGEWKEIIQSTFSYDATGKAGDRIDYGGGVESNRFYLWNGGYQPANARYGDVFNRDTINKKPVIDFYKNADSSIEAKKEKAIILSAISAGKFDTTGSINGIYYKILQDGSGDNITVSDTVVVHYKGTLLNGNIFDQTTDKPATFPLNRLIKGWQYGLPMSRIGGKIRLIMPSYLAYSIRNLGDIPPNSPLVFEIEVLESKKVRH